MDEKFTNIVIEFAALHFFAIESGQQEVLDAERLALENQFKAEFQTTPIEDLVTGMRRIERETEDSRYRRMSTGHPHRNAPAYIKAETVETYQTEDGYVAERMKQQVLPEIWDVEEFQPAVAALEERTRDALREVKADPDLILENGDNSSAFAHDALYKVTGEARDAMILVDIGEETIEGAIASIERIARLTLGIDERFNPAKEHARMLAESIPPSLGLDEMR